jgi:hypothetical protein
MRILGKILLAPIWLILFLLKWLCLIMTGIASGFLRIGGILLLLIGAAYWLLQFEPIQTIRVFAVGIGAIVAPYLGSVIIGVLEAGHTWIGEYLWEL